MTKRATYKRDRANDYRRHADGTESFSAFAVSEQIRKPTIQGAEMVAGIARGIAPKFGGGYARSFKIGRTRTIWFKPKQGPLQRRAVVEVINDDPKAVAMEFGSGPSSVGGSAGGARPQGGSNPAFRVLMRAGKRVGDFHGG